MNKSSSPFAYALCILMLFAASLWAQQTLKPDMPSEIPTALSAPSRPDEDPADTLDEPLPTEPAGPAGIPTVSRTPASPVELKPADPTAVPVVSPGESLEPLDILHRKPRNVTIGIVRDGPSWTLDQLIKAIERELNVLAKAEGDFTVEFKKAAAFDAGWNLKNMDRALKNALDDPGPDLVLAVGVLVTEAAARKGLTLAKPVVGGLILDADIADLPHDKEGRSTKPNFTFVVSSQRVHDDLEAFRKMIPFGSLHVLADAKLIEGIKGFGSAFSRMGKELGFTAVIVPINTSAKEVLARLGSDVEAVYLIPPFRMSRAEKQALINGINEKKIPSFALMGLPDVEKGVLAGIAPRTTRLLARRIAINIHRIIQGESPNDFSVYLTLQKQLVVNAKTAEEIGYSPNFETVMTADFLHQESLEKGDPLTLQQAMEAAAVQNIDLAIRDAEVRASRQDRNKAFSFLLPQVGGNTRYELIDKDRAQASFGQQPEWSTLLGFQVNQILFDDETFSNWRSSKRTYRQRSYEEEDLRLDIIELSATRFFNYLSAKLILKIEIENLRLTKSNLELARVRYRVGTGGREEVYRWEAQLARNKSSVLEAESAVEQARVALNQTLGVDQDREWKARDIMLADDNFYFLDNRLKGIIDNEAQLNIFRQFAVDDAFENSPALMAVGQAIDAQRISLNQLKRKFGLPSFNGVFDFDHTMNRHRVNPPGGVPEGAGLFLPDQEDWFLGVGASLPLFEGGGRLFDVRKAYAGLDRLTSTRERLRQLIEQRTLTAMYDMQSSHPNIRLSRQAADRAHKNLEIVTSKYTQGTVSILDLLDAQNQALTEDRAAAISVYDYLKNLYEFQRSIAWFQDFKTREEKDDWVAEMDAFMRKGAGKGSGTP